MIELAQCGAGGTQGRCSLATPPRTQANTRPIHRRCHRDCSARECASSLTREAVPKKGAALFALGYLGRAFVATVGHQFRIEPRSAARSGTPAPRQASGWPLSTVLLVFGSLTRTTTMLAKHDWRIMFLAGACSYSSRRAPSGSRGTPTTADAWAARWPSGCWRLAY